MKAVIIDDQESVRQSLSTLLSIYAPDIDLQGVAEGVNTGIALIKKIQPELVFLDVEMGDGSGFDLIQSFPERPFAVIFITAHDEYAVKAFKFSAIDFLQKPIDPVDLERAVNKARETARRGASDLSLKTLESNLLKKKLERIVLKDSERIYVVGIHEIIYCKSENNYTRFFLTDGREILISNTLKEYENLLADSNFFRCHQSHLINLYHMSFYDRKEGGSIHMKNGAVLPVSTRKKEQLLRTIDML